MIVLMEHFGYGLDAADASGFELGSMAGIDTSRTVIHLQGDAPAEAMEAAGAQRRVIDVLAERDDVLGVGSSNDIGLVAHAGSWAHTVRVARIQGIGRTRVSPRTSDEHFHEDLGLAEVSFSFVRVSVAKGQSII